LINLLKGEVVNKEPEFRIYTGPMFGSKTTKMLSTLERCLHQNKKVVAFKPRMDDRYSESQICTHAGLKFPAKNVSSGNDIIKMSEGYDVVGVDEAFMIDGSAAALLKLFFSGKTIVVSSIQLSASGVVFDEIKDILPWATHVEVCPAVCVKSGNDAFYTVRKSKLESEIEVGGSDLYEPRSWSNTHFFNF
jgi:thymidine kinase